jgi:hypothetical protein
MRNNESGALKMLDNICHGKCFTGSRNAQQNLVFVFFFDAINQSLNGLRLVSGRLVI